MSVVRLTMRLSICLLFLLTGLGFSCQHYDREGRLAVNVVFDENTDRPLWVVQYDSDSGRIKEVVLLPDPKTGRAFVRATFDEEGNLASFRNRRGYDLQSPETMHQSAEHILGNLFFANAERAIRMQIQSRGAIDLMHLGDSITWGWTQHFFQYVHYYGDRNAIVTAVIGNQISNLLHQLNDVNLAGLNPKAVVVNIGTNNSKPRGTIEETAIENAWGIVAILARITAKLPNTHIILMGIFPRGMGILASWNSVNVRVNELISGFDDNGNIHFRNINHVFLNDDGTIRAELFDKWILHPLTEGLMLWAEAIDPLVSKCLGEVVSDTKTNEDEDRIDRRRNRRHFSRHWRKSHRHTVH